ncbi:hypothetical protein ACFL3S_11770 [Gemmatimonadota bacterium]
MARNTLVETHINAATELLETLDNEGLRVGTAFWQFDEESDDWYLFLSTPLLASTGKREFYERIDEILTRLDSPLDLMRIKLLDESKPLVREIPRSIGVVPSSTESPQWHTSSSTSTASGVSTGDFLVYRSTG